MKMRKKFEIDGQYELVEAIKIDVNSIKIVVFKNEIVNSEFKVSLMPTGDDEKLSTYQLDPTDQIISKSIKEALPEISDWLKSIINVND